MSQKLDSGRVTMAMPKIGSRASTAQAREIRNRMKLGGVERMKYHFISIICG